MSSSIRPASSRQMLVRSNSCWCASTQCANPALGRRGARRLASSRASRGREEKGTSCCNLRVEGCDRRRKRCKSAQIALDCALRMRMPFPPIRACGLSSLLLRTKEHTHVNDARAGATPVSPVAFGAVLQPAGLCCSQSENEFRKSISARRASGVLPAACRPRRVRASRVCLSGWLAGLSLCVRLCAHIDRCVCVCVSAAAHRYVTAACKFRAAKKKRPPNGGLASRPVCVADK
jgi:hypothetical protein